MVFPKGEDVLHFQSGEFKASSDHVTGTKCRPDIIAVFKKDQNFSKKGGLPNWGLIRLAGEKASKGKSFREQKKQSATYLHYLLVNRPDFLVAQGLLTTKSRVVFLLGYAGVGIRQHMVKWKDKTDLYEVLYGDGGLDKVGDGVGDALGSPGPASPAPTRNIRSVVRWPDQCSATSQSLRIQLGPTDTVRHDQVNKRRILESTRTLPVTL